MPLDLSKVQLPEDVGNQPADITLNTQLNTDQGGANENGSPTNQGNEPGSNQGAGVTPDPANQPTPPASTEDGAGKPAAQAPNPQLSDPATQPQEDPTKLTPFHEHPDWKKLQDEKHQLEVKLARLEGSVNSLSKPAPVLAPLPFNTVQDLAQDLIQKKKAAGWQPQSAEEVAMVTQAIWDQARQTFSDHEEAEQQANLSLRQQEIIQTVNDLGFAGEENATTRQVLFKIAGKIDPNLTRSQRDVLMEAYEIMKELTPQQKAQAETTTPNPAPTQPAQQTTTPATTTAQTNRRISQGSPTGSTGASNKDKPSFDRFKKESLDQAIERAVRENNLS